MKKFVQYIISSFLVLAVFVTARGVYAATLDFDPDSTAVQLNSTFDVKVNVDAGTQQIAGTDIYIDYDSSYLEFQSVTAGTYFSLVNNVSTTGRLYISGVVATQGDYKTGSGTVATVKFKALQEGSATLTFDCNTAETETSKVVQNDVDATNVLVCSGLQSHAITISASVADTTSSTSELPQSGGFEDLAQYTLWGGVLLALGISIRLLLKFV